MFKVFFHKRELKAFLVQSKFLHKLFGVNTTAVYHNAVAQAQIRTLPWDPMVSKRRVSEAERAIFSNSIYHRAPGPKEVFQGPSADTRIKERTPVGRRSGKGIEPRILLLPLQQFQELRFKTGALTQPSAPFCRWRS